MMHYVEFSEYVTGILYMIYKPRLYTPLFWSVSPLVRHTLLFLGFSGLKLHCSSPNDKVNSNTVPAPLHATGVTVYPALFSYLKE